MFEGWIVYVERKKELYAVKSVKLLHGRREKKTPI